MPSVVWSSPAAIPEFVDGQAKCAEPGQNPDLWAAGGKAVAIRRAARVCRVCPLADACLAWGQANRQSGVWGGSNLIGGKVDRRVRSA